MITDQIESIRIKLETETDPLIIGRAAHYIGKIENLFQTTKCCKKCNQVKDIEDFPFVMANYMTKSKEVKSVRVRRNVCSKCFNKQTSSANRKRVHTKKEFNWLF